MYTLHLWLWLHNDCYYHLGSITRDKQVWRHGEAMDDAFENWFPPHEHPPHQTKCKYVNCDCYLVSERTTRGTIVYAITSDDTLPIW